MRTCWLEPGDGSLICDSHCVPAARASLRASSCCETNRSNPSIATASPKSPQWKWHRSRKSSRSSLLSFAPAFVSTATTHFCTCARKSSLDESEPPSVGGRAKPKTIASRGRWRRCHSLKSVGMIFLLARLPSAPKTMIETSILRGRRSSTALVTSSVPSSSESEFSACFFRSRSRSSFSCVPKEAARFVGALPPECFPANPLISLA
mmetsp:Transcript_27709/g.74731  ORF Transcript_27709/g.74731 Transcript_27709/m.74731 type:complete len:207 (-) Transcript_27709:45-665(-)